MPGWASAINVAWSSEAVGRLTVMAFSVARRLTPLPAWLPTYESFVVQQLSAGFSSKCRVTVSVNSVPNTLCAPPSVLPARE